MDIAVRCVFLIFMAALYAAVPQRAFASSVYLLEPGQDIIGGPAWSYAMEKDTLLDIARDYDLGYNEIIEANPGVDPWVPKPGSRITAPVQWILPSVRREGIVLNMAEMRLFYFYQAGGARMVVTYPVGVGREGFSTPLGVYRVTGKAKDPAWYPPPSVREEKPGLPDAVPPGPDNPLGARKITINLPGYLIHGTNRPWGVGRRVSHGCIRLYPEDIVKLYTKVRPGARVEIVYQPVKVGMAGGRLFVEVHKDYMAVVDLLHEAMSRIEDMGLADLVDREALKEAIREKSGVPADVTLRR